MADWTARSRFENDRARNSAVKESLATLLEERADPARRTPVELDEPANAVLGVLVAPLREDPPRASQAAEAALALAQFTLVEGRVLNLANPERGDLHNNRIAGDRAVGDDLCRNLLAPRNIPSTQGPLQSSSFRGGYLSEQVRNDGIRRYVAWQSADERTVADVQSMAFALVDELLDRASPVPPMPALAAARFTFIAYRQVRGRLLSKGSGGAFEQYLLAGLLNEEMAQGGHKVRATPSPSWPTTGQRWPPATSSSGAVSS